jgi:hypothetical protein
VSVPRRRFAARFGGPSLACSLGMVLATSVVLLLPAFAWRSPPATTTAVSARAHSRRATRSPWSPCSMSARAGWVAASCLRLPAAARKPWPTEP